MCGFIGGVFRDKKDSSFIENSLALINHRGPDGARFSEFELRKSFLYLGHARLSIIDLSDAGLQPFHSSCGRYSLIYNGEIYNYKELRRELEILGFCFSTDSDTEVLLNSLIKWGLDCLPRLVGMFSFVLYDHDKETLNLVRDAFGIKPFYYYTEGEQICFSSELPALLELKDTETKPDLQRAYDYLVHGDYDSNERSFIEGINHLPAAHHIIVDLRAGDVSAPIRWWQPNTQVNPDISFDDAVSRLRTLFLESVQLHLRSDVPIGIALSGGIDSSAVVSAVRHINPDLQIKTFSYIASDPRISEEIWVDLLNEEKATESYKVIADQKEMRADLDEMLMKQGEPFGSTSIYAQYRVFRLAKESGITVMLDGQGADELLAGYSGYPGHRILSIIESEGWYAAHRYAKRWAKAPGRSYFLAWQYFLRIKLSDRLYKAVRKKMGREFKPAWLNNDYLLKCGVVFKEERSSLCPNNRGKRVKEALASALTGRGLASLLRHGDRNSMAFSIESRVPFLSLPLAEFLLSLPEHYLISNTGVTKYAFREAMRGIVPDAHLDRQDKIGFATPESKWLLHMGKIIKEWIHEAPELPFINKAELLSEFNDVMDGKRSFDGRVWRWVNYLRWCTLVGIR